MPKTALFSDDDEPAFSNHMTRLRVDTSRLDPGFLALRLHQTWREGWFAAHCNNHVSQASISREVLRTLPIEMPPLDVQRAITVLAHAIDSRTASNTSHLNAAGRAVRNFRQAVLAAAYREAIDDEFGQGIVPLDNLLAEPLKNGYSARPVNHKTQFRVLTLTATTSGWFDPQHFKYTDEEIAADSPVWVTPDDILVQRGNTPEYVGVPALYEGDSKQFIYPDLMIRVRIGAEIGPRYVWYMLLAPQSRNFLRERATGSAGNMPKINQQTLREVPIPLATPNTRAEIVTRLDKALAMATEVESRILNASRHADRSLPAILAKAFRGQLVASAEDIAKAIPV